jgi:hypothetical protein
METADKSPFVERGAAAVATEKPNRPSPVTMSLGVAGVTVAFYVLGLLVTPNAFARFHFSDFGTFYRGAATGLLYGPDPDLPVVGPVTMTTLNPPHFHLFLRPLTGLPLPAAYLGWMTLSACAIGIGWWRTALRIRPAWPWWMWFVISAWTPLCTLMYTGQITALIFVPLLLAWWADREGRGTAAGAWMGLALSVKPNLIMLLVWWLFRRRWREIGTAAVTALAACLVGVIVFGWHAYETWLRNLSSATWAWAAMNACLWALPSRLWQQTPYYPHLAERPDLVILATAVLVVPVAAATFWGLWRTRDADIAWTLALVSCSMVMPLGWVYYAWWWVPMAMGLPLRRRAWLVVAVLLLVPATLVIAFVSDSVLVAISVGSAPVFATLALWCAVTRLAVAARPVRAASVG